MVSLLYILKTGRIHYIKALILSFKLKYNKYPFKGIAYIKETISIIIKDINKGLVFFKSL
jgi:hypothetical protein